MFDNLIKELNEALYKVDKKQKALSEQCVEKSSPDRSKELLKEIMFLDRFHHQILACLLSVEVAIRRYEDLK